MSASDPRALSPEARSFVDKWLQLEPEMEPALLFAPAPERALAACWGALQNELFDAIAEPRDSGVAQVKLAWWGEALSRGAEQGASHPLVRALFAHAAAVQVPGADWQALVRAALDLGADESTPADMAAALRVRLAYARALGRIEAALFAATATDGLADAIAVGLLLRQLRGALRGRRARIAFVPLQLLARHGQRASGFDPQRLDATGAALVTDLATALLATLPPRVQGAAMRRCRTAFDRRILGSIAARPVAVGAGLSRWAALWTAWRAARRASA